MTSFVGKRYFIMKGSILVHNAYIFNVWVFKNIVIDSSSTRVDSLVMHETRIGVL